MNPHDYSTIAYHFPKFLGIIYIVSFMGLFFQICGLMGTNGILPIKNVLNYYGRIFDKRKKFYYLPTLFWFNSSNRALKAACLIGAFMGALLIGNPCPALTPLFIIICYLLQLSILSVGQDFMGFGWEIYLCDLSFTTFFLSFENPPNLFVWLSLNLMLFRCYFQAGASKLLSRDKNWRNLTAVAFHYQTQPLPNTQAWFFHKLPLWMQKFSTFIMFVSELGAPFLIFGTQEMRLIGFILIAGLQVFIWFTGNFSYLNHMTFVFSFILLSNRYLGIPPETAHFENPLLDIFLSGVGIFLIFIQLASFWNYFFPHKSIFSKILAWISPFQIVSRFGIFAVMTVKRFEIVIEGSNDGKEWKEYTFYFKPSQLTKRPKRISPYQPRLDWMMWFLPFRPYEQSVWFHQFLQKLLEGSEDVLKLIEHCPFKEPPQYIRALVYDYEFSDYQTLKSKKEWWTRKLLGAYSPILILKKP